MTTGPEDAGRIARESIGGYEVIVAVGGDGTVSQVVSGMVSSSLPLGIIPAGSGNDFIKSLNIPNDLEKAFEIVIRGTTRVIDVGRINGIFFANGVGIGFDAAVNRASYSINHSKKGLLLYVWALVKTLGRFNPVPMTVTMNGERREQEVFLLSVGNGTTVGGGFRLTPHARLDDGLLRHYAGEAHRDPAAARSPAEGL